jgi:hypothetical protein
MEEYDLTWEEATKESTALVIHGDRINKSLKDA